jgi:DNA-directed RNA polymerase specialized sigma24 family protein
MDEESMEKPDPLYGEWVLLGTTSLNGERPDPLDNELLSAARQAWPLVLAHARRKLAGRRFFSDSTVVAADVWEKLLVSVSKARQRKAGNRPRVSDLKAYLIGIFHRRFNRFLRLEQRRIATIEFVSSTIDLEKFENAKDTEWVAAIERAITVEQIVAHMDEWTRRVWRGRQCRFSWKEISRPLGLTEQNTIMRYRYGLRKTRERLIESLKRRRTTPPGQL